MKNVAAENKKEAGQLLNEFKSVITQDYISSIDLELESIYRLPSANSQPIS